MPLNQNTNRQNVVAGILVCLGITYVSHCQGIDRPIPAKQPRLSVVAHGQVLVKHGQVIMEDRADILKECLALMEEGLTMMHDGQELMNDHATHDQGQMLFKTGQMMKSDCSNAMDRAAAKRMGKRMIDTGKVLIRTAKPAGN